MYKLLTVFALASLTAGCTTHVYHGQGSVPVAGACEVTSHYDVTLDSWCGNGCTRYPVSHKMRYDNRRVELNGVQTAPVCAGQ